jgi:hypothetical protein
MGWPLMTNQLRKMNFPVGETIPKENTTGWIDHLMITAGSENKESGVRISGVHDRGADAEEGYGCDRIHSGEPAGSAVDDAGDEVKSLHLDDVDNYQKRLYFWQNVPRRAKYNEIWNEVKAAQ